MAALISLIRPWISSFLPAPPTRVVLSLSTTIRLQRPRSLTTVFSSLKPTCSLTTLPPVTEAWRLDAADLERAAQLVHHQGRQCLPFDVLGDEEERFPRLRHLFQDR